MKKKNMKKVMMWDKMSGGCHQYQCTISSQILDIDTELIPLSSKDHGGLGLQHIKSNSMTSEPSIKILLMLRKASIWLQKFITD